MVIVWVVIEVLFLVCFFSLPAFAEPTCPNESTPLVTEKSPSMQQTTINNSAHTESTVNLSWSMRIWNITREETVVLLAVLFVTMFNQTSIEV